MRFTLQSIALALLAIAMSNSRAARADVPDEQFRAAAEYYRQADWQKACDVFDKLLASHPDYARGAQARFFYGEALAQLNRLEAARGQFEELLRRDPDHRYARQALFRSGEAAYLLGDLKAAERDLQAFHKRYPEDELGGYVQPYLASLELHKGNARAAEQLFSTALERFDDGPLAEESRLGLARAREQLGQLEEARQGYRKVAEGGGTLVGAALLSLGNLDNAAGDHAAALVTFEKLAASSAPAAEQAKGKLGRGYALYKLHRTAEAERVLADLLTDSNLRVEAHYWLGLSQKERRQWSDAYKTLSAGQKLDPEHRLAAALGFQAADALFEDGQFAQAAREFDRALERWPQGDWADECLFGKLRIAARLKEDDQCVRLADELRERFPESPLRPHAQLAKAKALFALSKYTEAAASLEPLIESNATTKFGVESQAEARALLAQCQTRSGKLQDANQTLVALGDGPDASQRTAQARLEIAESAYAAGNFELAQKSFEGLLAAQNPPEIRSRGLSGLAWCHFSTSHWKESAEAFDEVLQLELQESGAAEAALMRGRALEHLDQSDTALAMYRVVIDRFASSDRVAEALWRAGLLHEKLQQGALALELYAELIEHHTDFPQLDAAIYRRAWLLEQAGDVAKADELLTRLRRDFPQSSHRADATMRLAEHAAARREYSQAESLLDEVTQPSSPTAVAPQGLYLKGRIAAAQERWGAVEAPLAQLTERFPDSQWIRSADFLRAEASYRLGNFEQAAERLAELAAVTKDRPEVWSALAELRRAQALAQLKRWDDALETARNIAIQFPNFDQQYEVDYLIGRGLAAQADFAAARESYGKVIANPRAATTETAAMAQWMIGETFFHQEKYAAALAEYLRVEDRYAFPRWQGASLLQAGKCHESLGQWQSAVAVYQRLLKTYPSSEFSGEAGERLAEASKRLARQPVNLR
jgi:TolA-binding protein